ncbi:MAG: N-acetylmuramoyl-L-alanine amidase [Anaerolineae bacterium]|nr:N-acetylmuramoyl-L-alanine amidase [Anaerolineae bacterium]
MPTRASQKRSPLRAIALVVGILLALMVGTVFILGLTETSPIANWLAGSPPQSPLIGIVAGHWQSDSGAVCPDGLEEVELNLQIARRVAHILRRQGYRVEVLPEFSPKLNGFQGAVFLSIHCDSCIEDRSGFKVARMTHSSVPALEDRLVQLLYQTYAEATGLKPDLNTITEDMQQYHAFRQIAPETPGAIIECGYMGGDRYLLTHEQDRVAVGIANGLLAFLRETHPSPSPTPQ